MVRDPTSPRLVRKAHLFASAQEALEKACKASSTRPHKEMRGREGNNDSEADVPSTKAFGAICVQNFNDSRGSAIHTTYRISLRSSSLREPRYPLLRVVFRCNACARQTRQKSDKLLVCVCVLGVPEGTPSENNKCTKRWIDVWY